MTLTKQRMLQAGVVIGLLALGGLLGCNALTGDQPLPAGTQNQSYYNTPTGAVSLRNAAIYDLELELPSYITNTGLLTDELESNKTGAGPGALLQSGFSIGGSIDARILPELTSGGGPTDNDYGNLQAVRGDISQAMGVLAAYDTAANSPILRGELYALNGYVEILLADYFCSGVPLSTLDFQNSYTYHASSTTVQVYQAALAQEDSALALASTNDTIQNLARVLKGRALLALNMVATAAQAVASVPDGFQYRLAIQWTLPPNTGNLLNGSATVSDREGNNGLPFGSSGDPRSATVLIANADPSNGTYIAQTFPAKYSPTGYTQFIVADGVEARLIQAESALQAGDPSWLTILNALRTDGTFTTAPDPNTPAVTDTSWNAGSAGVAGLKPLTDPGTNTGRVSLSFQERAYWLFVTGHRQGDLRRLVRQDDRREDQVYPIGAYLAPGGGSGQYGNDVTAPIPAAEYTNPLFHGCVDRHA